MKHQQRGVAFGVSIGVGDHRGRDPAVVVLHQCLSVDSLP
jgi:hypothetical protein